MTETAPRTRTIRANFLINIVGAFVKLFLSLLIVPAYIHLMGAPRYGILAVLWSLVGYSGFFDLGLSRAAANALARAKDQSQEQRSQILATAISMNAAMGVIGALGIYLFASFLLTHVIKAPADLAPEVLAGLPWIATMIPTTLVTVTCMGALESRENFVLANIVQIGAATLGQILPITLAWTISPSLSVVVAGMACSALAGMLVALVLAQRQEGRLHFSLFSFGKAKTLLSYGGWVTVTSILDPLLSSFDQILIGSLKGVTAVAHYSVAMSLAQRSQFIPAALARTLFPRLSSCAGNEAQNLASRAVISLAYVYGAVCAGAIVIMPTFFHFWIGGDFALISSRIAEVLFIGAWINGIAFVPFYLLQSRGRPDITGILHAAEILPFLGVLWVLTSFYGLMGAAIAWCLRVAVDALLLFYFTQIKGWALVSLLPPLLVLVAAVAAAEQIGPNILQSFALGSALGLVLMAVAIYISQDVRRILHLAAQWRPV